MFIRSPWGLSCSQLNEEKFVDNAGWEMFMGQTSGITCDFCLLFHWPKLSTPGQGVPESLGNGVTGWPITFQLQLSNKEEEQTW